MRKTVAAEKNIISSAWRPNQGVQRTPLARPLGWARSTRQNATASYQRGNPQPPAVRGEPTFLALQRSAARILPGSCLCPTSSTLHTPASGAADARRSRPSHLFAPFVVQPFASVRAVRGPDGLGRAAHAHKRSG